MSTRCRIGIKNENGSVTSIYCHHDGYLSYVGKKLKDFYKDEIRVRRLLRLGDISALGDNPVADPNAWKEFSFDDSMCTAYSTRDNKMPARVDSNEDDFRQDSEEYGYLFKDGEWFVSNHSRAFEKLNDLLK